MELQGRLEDIRKAGFGLAAISYDPVTVLADFATRRGISFSLLSDVGSRVIREYGILNTTVPPTNRDQHGIPFPGTFFVDRGGVVTSRVFENAYQERDTIASVMVRLGHGFAPAGTRVTAKAVRLVKTREGGVDGFVPLPGVDFQDGTIEADVAVKITTPPGTRVPGFIGVAFRARRDASSYDMFYVRPGAAQSRRSGGA